MESTTASSPAEASPVGLPADRAVADVVGALAALGYTAGERFELASIVELPSGKKRIASRLFANDVAGVAASIAWASERDARENLYLSSNPIKPNAAPEGRPGDDDVLAVRTLLVDPDPDDTSPEARAAAASIAAEVRTLCAGRLRIRPPLVDSARGHQVLVPHEPGAPGDGRVAAMRRRLLHAFARRFARPGAKIDKQVHNASRLVRLPGTVNLKTGERAKIRDAGDGRVASLADMEQLVCELEAELGPHAPSPDGSPPPAPGAERQDRVEPARVLAGVPEGERDVTLFRFACRLRHKGLSRVEAEVLVLEAARHCSPPFPEVEARAKVESAWRYGIDAKSDETAAAKARELLPALLEKAAGDPGAPFEPDALATLALLRKHDQAAWVRARADLKKARVPVGELDEALDRAWPEERAGPQAQGAAVALADPPPWLDPVDGAALLDELVGAFRAHLALGAFAAEALALWVVHTFALDAAEVSPRLGVTSPTKRCGKTRLLTLLRALVSRPVMTANVTAAALFRSVEAYRPTLLVDEADTFLADNDELRGILNAGHQRDGTVLRTVGEDHEPRLFSAWAAAAIALIGRLPSTLEDRSLAIEMRRRQPGEKVARLRLGRLSVFEPLRRKSVRWATDHMEELRSADATVPEQLDDRAADNWRALLAIADAVGGEWPARAREAALALSSGRDEGEGSLGVLLLTDLRGLFETRGVDRLPTGEIVAALVGMEDRPWPELSRGKPVTPRGVARLLRTFGVVPGTIRLADGKTPKGYTLDALADAFRRYLPPVGSATTPHPMGDQNLQASGSATDENRVADQNERNPVERQACGVVADRETLGGGAGHVLDRGERGHDASAPSEAGLLFPIDQDAASWEH